MLSDFFAQVNGKFSFCSQQLDPPLIFSDLAPEAMTAKAAAAQVEVGAELSAAPTPPVLADPAAGPAAAPAAEAGDGATGEPPARAREPRPQHSGACARHCALDDIRGQGAKMVAGLQPGLCSSSGGAAQQKRAHSHLPLLPTGMRADLPQLQEDVHPRYRAHGAS